jgi:hypothetical protein
MIIRFYIYEHLWGTQWRSWFVEHAVVQLVEVQSYKSEGHVFDSRLCH